jgi:hypothetical protein
MHKAHIGTRRHRGTASVEPARRIPIKPIIGIAEQRPLATIAALRDVERNPGENLLSSDSRCFSVAVSRDTQLVANDLIHSAVLYVASPHRSQNSAMYTIRYLASLKVEASCGAHLGPSMVG